MMHSRSEGKAAPSEGVTSTLLEVEWQHRHLLAMPIRAPQGQDDITMMDVAGSHPISNTSALSHFAKQDRCEPPLRSSCQGYGPYQAVARLHKSLTALPAMMDAIAKLFEHA